MKKILYFISAFLFLNCEDIVRPEENFPAIFEKTNLENEPSLSRALYNFNTLGAKSGRSLSSDSVETSFGKLDLSEIIKKLSGNEYRYPSYTIKLVPPDSVKHALEHLVLIGVDGGYRVYILQRQTNLKNLATLHNIDSFTGYIRILNLRRSVLAQNYFESGINVEIEKSSGKMHTSFNNCDCGYEKKLVVNKQDLSAYVIITGIVCTCEEVKQFDGSDAGGGGGGNDNADNSDNTENNGIGDFVPEPLIGLPEGGGSGSGGSEGSDSGSEDGENQDEIAFLELKPCPTDGNIRDALGNCISPEAYLINFLEEDPYALIDIDCDELEKWKEVVNTPLHKSAAQRLLDLEESTGGGFGDYLRSINDWEIQKISDAGGAAINLDYFSVNISKLPNNMNPSTFLNYVRLNMFDNLDNAKFSPHLLLPNEQDKWRDNPIASILSIDIEPPAGDGSVICIDASSNHWVFATIQDPKNLQHPVSGNRKFGIISNLSRSRGYTFYTRGTDRVKVGMNGIIRDIVFNMTKEGIDLMDNGSRPWNDVILPKIWTTI